MKKSNIVLYQSGPLAWQQALSGGFDWIIPADGEQDVERGRSAYNDDDSVRILVKGRFNGSNARLHADQFNRTRDAIVEAQEQYGAPHVRKAAGGSYMRSVDLQDLVHDNPNGVRMAHWVNREIERLNGDEYRNAA